MKKVILIGIDGATPQLLSKWIDQGKLPTFSSLREQGCSGKLASTIPPFSAPAWTSIVTGCNPGKHGIYGFESTGTLSPHLITSRSRKVPAIWNYLSSIGLKNIIINVPGSYPPDTINGVMITGLLTPSFDSQFTYPASLKDRLHNDDLGDYELEHFWLEDYARSRMKDRAPDQLLDLIINQMESRATVALNLMQSTPWDFTMLVFRGTDTAQHFLFHRPDLLLKCYQKVDTLINKIMTTYPQATFIIVSDHGFEPIKYILYPDNVLYNNHYLTPTWDPLQNYSSLILSVTYQLINRFMKILPGNYLRNAPRLKQLLLTNATKEKLINFHHTTAFSTADGRGIQICFKDKYPQGIVTSQDTHKIYNDLKTLFSSLKDPQTGNTLVQKIYLSEEVYGKNAQGPPDLILSLEKGVTASEWIRYPQTFKELLHTQPRTLPIVYTHDAAGRSGDHAEYGIFFTKGHNIKTNYTIDSITVEDILPLIFSILNLPQPHAITGKIPLKIFTQQPPPPQNSWEDLIQKKSPLTPHEINTITKLRNKGL